MHDNIYVSIKKDPQLVIGYEALFIQTANEIRLGSSTSGCPCL